MIHIYGASDDLIEIEGDISEEFPYYDGGANLLAFSDGTVLRAKYDSDGIWRFTSLFDGKARLVRIVQTYDDPDEGYSDQVYLYDEELETPIQWVVQGIDMSGRRR